MRAKLKWIIKVIKPNQIEITSLNIATLFTYVVSHISSATTYPDSLFNVDNDYDALCHCTKNWGTYGLLLFVIR